MAVKVVMQIRIGANTSKYSSILLLIDNTLMVAVPLSLIPELHLFDLGQVFSIDIVSWLYIRDEISMTVVGNGCPPVTYRLQLVGECAVELLDMLLHVHTVKHQIVSQGIAWVVQGARYTARCADVCVCMHTR